MTTTGDSMAEDRSLAVAALRDIDRGCPAEWDGWRPSAVGVCSQSKQYTPEHKQCTTFVLVLEVVFYVNLAVSHSGCGAGPPHTQRLG